MTSEHERHSAVAVPRATGSHATGSHATVRAYARLAKLDIFDYYLSALVVWTLLTPAARLDGRNLLTLAVFFLSEVCLIAALVAFDDVTGYRDGSDAINYGPDAPARRLARKPLLAGTLSEAEAVRFGWGAAGAGTLLCAASVVLAPNHRTWVVVAAVIYVVLCVQYSWGLKISYHGGQEAFIAGLGVAVVLVPYGLLSAEGIGFALVQAVLFGLGPLLFGVYSNINDITGDQRVRRPTVAATISPRGNAIFIGALSLAEAMIIIGSAAAGVAPWWFPFALLPVMVLRAVQLRIGLVRGEILLARRLGIRVHRVAVAALVVVNILYPLIGTGS
jgi:1,4-dihydroxy-2-naphthoate polyprenyltransferase